MERLATLTRSVEQERSELQAQYHQKLAQSQQERDREVYFPLVTPLYLYRSLTGVIEQMEQFSSRLGELSSRVESSHEHTAHGLEQGARHRDEQLRSTHSYIHMESSKKIRTKNYECDHLALPSCSHLSPNPVMQDHLAQQQKAMAEERACLKEIISRMDTQITEQQRQLEKERWKVTAEQAKAESTQRGLEEERRVFTMQISMEREELDRAKSSLLEEQKSVMQQCTEERRKLAAEWAHFRAQEKQRQDRAEREVNSLLERREGSIISLAQEQADLKLQMAELKQKELVVTQEKETLARLREELDRERETTNSMALRLKTRAQEVEAFSKVICSLFPPPKAAKV
ncbi:hypothetical protein XENOCAPTIV_002223 [Xenoophorus captivus]|uniref:Fas-binding factor 1 C-terminal domain-containing protein n=1 Tax=Xenoophorus captivus TaxID=1517983 RepID=A0ABV0S4T6_9TELE